MNLILIFNICYVVIFFRFVFLMSSYINFNKLIKNLSLYFIIIIKKDFFNIKFILILFFYYKNYILNIYKIYQNILLKIFLLIRYIIYFIIKLYIKKYFILFNKFLFYIFYIMITFGLFIKLFLLEK